MNTVSAQFFWNKTSKNKKYHLLIVQYAWRMIKFIAGTLVIVMGERKREKTPNKLDELEFLVCKIIKHKSLANMWSTLSESRGVHV